MEEKMPDFVHLHVHSEFSLLDGANKLEEGSKQLSSGMQEFDQNEKEKIVS